MYHANPVNRRRLAVEAVAKPPVEPSTILTNVSLSPHFIEFTMADGSTLRISGLDLFLERGHAA